VKSRRAARLTMLIMGVSLSTTFAHSQKWNISVPTNVVVGSSVTLNISIQNAAGAVVPGAGQAASITITGVAVSNPPANLPFTAGIPAQAAVQLIFTGTGTATLNVHDPAGAIPDASVSIAVASVQSICPECFASIGIGSDLSFTDASDYSNNSNILSSNEIGSSTPQYLIGVSFQTRIYGVAYHHLNCHGSDYASANPTSTYCYPWKAFINLKLSTSSNQTLSGFTFGLSHSLTSHLDIMSGFAYSAYNEPSPGFVGAAVQTVQTQQAAKNPYYTQFSPTDMNNKSKNAFDGFPTQLISSTGVAGAQIYSGNILSTNYHPGWFLGINVPISLGSLFSGTNGGK
jgi:hypothetical protein